MATVQARTTREEPPLRRPTEAEAMQAREAARRIDSAALVTVRDENGDDSPVEIPPLAFALFGQILDELARGHGVILQSVPRLVSIPRAAELLGVSRTFVSELIEKGELTSQADGDELRIVFEDLMDFKKRDDESTSKVLDELVAQAQELGLGY